MPHEPSPLIRKQNRDRKRMHNAAMAALQVAASDVVGDDPILQLEKIREWVMRAEDLLPDPDSSAVQ